GPRRRNPERFNSSDIRAIESATIRAYVSESLLSAPQNSGLLQPFNSTHRVRCLPGRSPDQIKGQPAMQTRSAAVNTIHQMCISIGFFVSQLVSTLADKW